MKKMKFPLKEFVLYTVLFLLHMVCILSFREYAIAVLAICVHGWMKLSADKLGQKIKAAKSAQITQNHQEDFNDDK